MTSEDVGDLPNIIVILTDDLGYGDISCYDSTLIDTPNIDRLADEGVEMTNFYSASPVCTPSRAGLLTGRYPNRAHMPNVIFPTGLFQHKIVKLMGGFSYGLNGIP